MNRSRTYPHSWLPQYVGTDGEINRIRNRLPTHVYERALAERDAQDRLEQAGGHFANKAYFLRAETPARWQHYETDHAWSREHRDLWKSGQPYDHDLVYIVNRPVAYARTLGWRTVPGVRWFCDRVARPDIAENYEDAIRYLLRDCDAACRLLAKKPTAEFLRDAGDNLVRPLLADIRQATADVVGELGQYSGLHGELPDVDALLREN